jgi:glycosyltransferase involved in cell wall biosynthesis
LLFTSYCHIGLVSYDTNILNNAYCAPNKIYEYTAYGKPIIGNNIPGLKVLENYKAGILVDENDENSILSALSRLEESYMTYSNGALKLFVDNDNKKTIKSTIGDLQNLDS